MICLCVHLYLYPWFRFEQTFSHANFARVMAQNSFACCPLDLLPPAEVQPVDVAKTQQIPIDVLFVQLVLLFEVAFPVQEIFLFRLDHLKRLSQVGPLDNLEAVFWQKHFCTFFPVKNNYMTEKTTKFIVTGSFCH